MSRVVQSLRPDGSTSSQVVAPTRRSVLTRTGTLLAESLGAAAAAAGGPTQPHIVGQGALRSFAPLSTGSRPVARSPSPPLSGRSSQTSVDLTLTAATPSAALAEAPGRGTAVDSRLTDTHIHRPLSTVTHAGSTLRVGSYGVILEDLLTMIWYTGQPHALHCTGTTAGLLNAVRSLDETLTSKGLCVCAGSVQELLQSAQRRLHKIRDQTDLKLLAQFFIAPVRVVEPLKFGSVSTRVSNLRLVSFPLMVMLIEMVADLLTKGRSRSQVAPDDPGPPVPRCHHQRGRIPVHAADAARTRDHRARLCRRQTGAGQAQPVAVVGSGRKRQTTHSPCRGAASGRSSVRTVLLFDVLTSVLLRRQAHQL